MLVSFLTNSYSSPRQDQLALKIVLPEKLTCIAVDLRGDYCVGGTAQGRIYLWEASKTYGEMFSIAELK